MNNNLQTDRLFLKEIQPLDINKIHNGLSNPEVTKYYAVHFETLEDTLEQMKWFKDLRKNQSGIWWGINFKGSGGFCGACDFNSIDNLTQKAELGFLILPQYWQTGIMTEIIPLTIRYGGSQLGLRFIEAFVENENEPCKKALDRH